MRIHKAGYKPLIKVAILIILISIVILGLAWWINSKWLSILLIFPLTFQIWAFTFFRYPNRSNLNHEKGKIYSAADGKIVLIEQIPASKDKEKHIQVSVFMSIYNIHLNYIPISGRIIHSTHKAGLHLMAIKAKASLLNEQIETEIEIDNSKHITIRQIAGAAAQRVISFIQKDQDVKSGEELGFIRFGSRVDHLIPADANVLVQIGDKVKGSITVLAEL